MAENKDEMRRQLQAGALPSFSPGKVAEALRRQDDYRQSSTLFVSPVAQLAQIRVNALLDGKMLVMPGPALKKGFYALKPYSVAFKDLGHAVSLKGIELFGRLLGMAKLQDMHIDLAITDCLAVDAHGGRLGHGTGFFDLAMALLAEVGAVDDKTRCIAVGDSQQLFTTTIPQEPWDVGIHLFLEAQGGHPLSPASKLPALIWEELEHKRIRKIEPLWQLHQTRTA